MIIIFTLVIFSPSDAFNKIAGLFLDDGCFCYSITSKNLIKSLDVTST